MDALLPPEFFRLPDPGRGQTAGATMPSLTISFCTRNREADLTRAIESVYAQAAEVAGCNVTLMVVDDGELPEAVRSRYAAAATEAGWRFHYFNKRARGGLFRSRIETIQTAQSDVVLFFDDDVTVETGYLYRLLERFRDEPALAGLGGVDLLCAVAPLPRRIYERLILYRASLPGRLSITGYGGSMDRWTEQTRVFDANYLYGCNMAYRRSALLDMRDPMIFEGHATAEDLYLAAIAGRSGRVLVDPALKVRHYQSPMARDRMDQVFFRQVVNHFRILEDTGASAARRWLVLYTAAGLVAIAAARCLFDVLRGRPADQWPRLRGGLRGLGFVAGNLMAPARRPHSAR